MTANTNGNLAYELDGGGGYINMGYVVFNTQELLVFPLLGLGLDALGIEQQINEDIAFETNQFLAANYFIVSPNIDLGVGIDWFPQKKEYKLGLRVGYNLSFSDTNKWRHYGGEITNNDLPNNDLNGFYLRLTLGGEHFTAK